MITLLLSAVLSADPYALAYEAYMLDDRPLVVLLTAEWCGPCRSLRADYPALRRWRYLAVVDVDREADLVRRMGQAGQGIPRLVVYQKGRPRRVVVTAAQIRVYAKEKP
jgi:thiol-disulfide isomerase/thioredoxin